MIDWQKNMRWEPYIKQTPERKRLADEVIELRCLFNCWVGENALPAIIVQQWRKQLTKWTIIDMTETIEEYKRVIALSDRR